MTNLLGSFLRAQRELVTPQQVGLPAHGVRRTPGLRREEVAMLAGISADYYLRLERGKDRHPSGQVLSSIARVLRLDAVHRDHLMTLAGLTPERVRRPRADVPPSVLALVDALGQPAYVEDRYFDVVASNALARALSPGLEPGGNQLRDLFLSPAEQALHPDWRTVTECWVANLRQVVGSDVDDPQFVALTTELAEGSARFRELWARQEVKAQSSGTLRISHPVVGELMLNRDRLAIAGTGELMLVVYHPAPGSDAAERLSRLSGDLADPRLDATLAGASRRS